MARDGSNKRIMLLAIALTKVWRPVLLVVSVLSIITIWLWLPDREQPNSTPSPMVEPYCGIPGTVEEGTYGIVSAERLPWARGLWPSELAALQTEHGAYRLIASFRTTLSDPVLDEVANVAVAAGHLKGTVLHNGERLSLNRTIGPYTALRGYLDGPMYSGGRVVPSLGGGVCKMATTLYNAATLAGLTIVERHPHSMQVPYVPPGRDAAVAWGHKDLQIQNPYDSPVVIWAQVEEQTLYVALYGDHNPPEVQWHHEEMGREAKSTIRRYNPDLAAGEENVVMDGFDGVTVRTRLTVTDADGTVHERNLGVDYYRPMPRVVEYGG